MSQSGENNPAFKHGHTTGKFSPTYYSWSSMLQRVDNKNRKTYKYYGGRGITVCKRWRTFTNFLEDMGERPPGTSLERSDNDGNYEPDNCVWADATTQARNSSQSLKISIGGVALTLPNWCAQLGISINTVRSRIKKHKWDVVSALTTPVQSVPFTKEKR